MVHSATLTAAAAALLLALPAAASMYPKGSSVINVDARTYDRLVVKSNYTTVSNWTQNILVFYSILS
jgi:protein disulfide-isomerase A6